MPIGKGQYAALQQLQPLPKPNFGEVARDVADRQIAREARDEAKKDKILAQQAQVASNFNSDYGTLTDVITGTESIDEAFAGGVGQARDMMGEIYKKIQTNPSLANDVSTQLKLQNLRNYAKNLKVSSDKVTEFNSTLAAGIQDGSLSGWNNKHLNIADSIYKQKNLTVGVDSMGRAIGATVKVDDNGEVVLGPDGKPMAEELRLPQILEGGGLPELVPVYNLAAEAQGIGPDLGKRVIKNTDGSFSHNEYQSFGEIEPDVRNLVKGFIGDVRNPSAVAKSIWTDVLGNEPEELDAEDMKEIEDTYTNVIKSFYDENAKQTTDFGARNAAAERRRKEAADAKGDKSLKGTGIKLRKGLDGKPITASAVQALAGDNETGFSFSLPPSKDIKITKGTQEINIDNIYLTKDGGIVYSGTHKVGKASGKPASELFNASSGTFSETIVERKTDGGMSQSEMNDLARAFEVEGINNAEDLKNELEKVVKEENTGGKDVKKMTAKEKIEFYRNKK